MEAEGGYLDAFQKTGYDVREDKGVYYGGGETMTTLRLFFDWIDSIPSCPFWLIICLTYISWRVMVFQYRILRRAIARQKDFKILEHEGLKGIPIKGKVIE